MEKQKYLKYLFFSRGIVSVQPSFTLLENLHLYSTDTFDISNVQSGIDSNNSAILGAQLTTG